MKDEASETCKELSQRINEKENEVDFIISFLPMFCVVGEHHHYLVVSSRLR